MQRTVRFRDFLLRSRFRHASLVREIARVTLLAGGVFAGGFDQVTFAVKGLIYAFCGHSSCSRIYYSFG